MSKTYLIATAKFGDVPIDADSIREARARAKKLFRARPSDVRLAVSYRLCERRDSKPCTCEVRP